MLKNTKLKLTSEFTSQMYSIGGFVGDYEDFMKGSFYALTSLPSKQVTVSNFGQYDDDKFWQMTTTPSLAIHYDRLTVKPLQHQWNELLGPLSLSVVDLFGIEYKCLQGNYTQRGFVICTKGALP